MKKVKCKNGQIDPSSTLATLEVYDFASWCRDYGAGDPYNYALTPLQVKLLYNGNAAVRFGPASGQP